MNVSTTRPTEVFTHQIAIVGMGCRCPDAAALETDLAASWVRNFAIASVPQVRSVDQNENWAAARILIVVDRVKVEFIESLRRRFSKLGAQSTVVTCQQVSAYDVIAELGGDEAIVTVGYDADCVRQVPQVRLQQPIDYSRRSSWSNQDVVLVTGGAKGITAECALAFARSTGVEMVLVDRSPAPAATDSTSEVAQTLARFQAEELNCHYYACDITDETAVANLVATVTIELGSITGVFHGAGLNQPRRNETVSLEAAQAEVSPKVLGAENLLQHLDPDSLKLFLAFTEQVETSPTRDAKFSIAFAKGLN
jgi:FlaA1/EpsC-like NDP-sugar epimerase